MLSQEGRPFTAASDLYLGELGALGSTSYRLAEPFSIFTSTTGCTSCKLHKVGNPIFETITLGYSIAPPPFVSTPGRAELSPEPAKAQKTNILRAVCQDL